MPHPPWLGTQWTRPLSTSPVYQILTLHWVYFLCLDIHIFYEVIRVLPTSCSLGLRRMMPISREDQHGGSGLGAQEKEGEPTRGVKPKPIRLCPCLLHFQNRIGLASCDAESIGRRRKTETVGEPGATWQPQEARPRR